MANRTEELRKQLQKVLKTATSNVHFEQAPDAANYPYIVYELSELTYSDGKSTMQLEVNVLGYGTNTAAIESIADAVQTTLNDYFYINPYIQFTAYRGARNTIKEDDKQIIRRRLTFEIQLHEL